MRSNILTCSVDGDACNTVLYSLQVGQCNAATMAKISDTDVVSLSYCTLSVSFCITLGLDPFVCSRKAPDYIAHFTQNRQLKCVKKHDKTRVVCSSGMLIFMMMMCVL